MPRIIDKWLHVTQDGYAGVERRYRGRFGQKPRIIVIHIQEGSNWGSWQHFHHVKASSTVLIGKNGDIWRLVPESDAPWTNGDVCNPTAKGRSIINRFGADPNVYSLTIETEGYHTEWPKPQAQLDSVVWQVRQWMDKYDIPLENVLRHADINQCSRPNCPGNAFYNYVINALKSGGAGKTPTTGGSTSQYATPMPVKVDGKAWDGSKDVEVNGVTFFADKRTVTTSAVLNCRQWASSSSGLVRSALPQGTKVEVLGWCVGENVSGENRWWVTQYGTRLWVGGTIEKPKRKPAQGAKPDTDGLAKVVNGIVFYPAGVDDEGKQIKVTRVGNLHQYAGLGSKVVKRVQTGTTLKALYWCKGDVVDKEYVWWVLAPEDGSDDAIGKGLRIPAAYTNIRPS